LLRQHIYLIIKFIIVIHVFLNICFHNYGSGQEFKLTNPGVVYSS